jgi:carboxypeptidase C (cathepsin A)
MSDTPPSAKPADKAADKPAVARLREAVEAAWAEAPARSRGVSVLGESTLDYRVEAGFVPVVSEALDEHRGEPQAAVFTTAYLLEAADPTRSAAPTPVSRPVCFAFNGGPGSSSIWLHLGALGPKRVRVHDDGSMPPAPYTVEDNPLSWFDQFDLVFIDPPHTGFSITASDDARKKALSVDGDVALLAQVVRGWLTRHGRWGAPLYLAGESYGTTRGAALADALAEMGIALTGLILVSCAMDLQALEFAPRNDLPYALFLPAFAGVAQFHGKLKGALAQSPTAARAAATEFVHGAYLSALHQGASLPATQRTRTVRRLAELTGLAPALIDEKNLRISDTTFFFELLRDRGQMVGRLEARVTGPMAASRTRDWEFDPGIEALYGPYTAAALGYFGHTLGLPMTRRFEIMSGEVNKQWNWRRGESTGNSYACTSTDLSRAIRRNPHLSVFVASGYYDLGTPYSASDWSLAQLDIPAALRPRITHRYYDAGHMMYTRQADLAQLKRDLVEWMGRPAG